MPMIEGAVVCPGLSWFGRQRLPFADRRIWLPKPVADPEADHRLSINDQSGSLGLFRQTVSEDTVLCLTSKTDVTDL
jgi:hypothetical protein